MPLQKMFQLGVSLVEDSGSIPGLGRSSEGGNGNPSQYSCLENLMERGAQRVIVHGVTESDMTEREKFLMKKPQVQINKCSTGCICLQCGRPGFHPWVGKISWRRKWQSTPVLLPGKSHGQRSLVGYSPWGRKELDMTERLHVSLVGASQVALMV